MYSVEDISVLFTIYIGVILYTKDSDTAGHI